ncbi:hypothetical protein ACQR0Z_05795 [Bradyrhizobium sp. HKCCYLS3077]|uniref:hypothetical protein n=1 Tax=Bradyrhizobium sp. HKCCYLS3077 TaxID=3420761 RepID=UPI003EBB3E73
MPHPIIANYQEPRQKIRELANPECPLRVLFLEGGENYGKSYLIQCVSPEWRAHSKFVVVELDKRRDIPSPLEILVEISSALGPENFPHLEAEVRRAQQRRLQANANNNTISGTNIRVEVLAQETDDDRLITSIQLTSAFAKDLENLRDVLGALILVFDGYDHRLMNLVDRWFDRSLIRTLSNISYVRLIVCGRDLPMTTVKARAAPDTSFQLSLAGVTEEGDWLPVVAALRRRLPGEAIEEKKAFLNGLIFAHEGAPGLIMRRIKMLEVE